MADLKKEIENRRTFAIISHPDAGKTTITEKFLLYGGAIQGGRHGQGQEKTAATRSPTGWRSKSSAVFRSPRRCYSSGTRGKCINIPDTPGHQDFRGYLPHADGGGFGGHGYRRVQRRGGADAQAVQGVRHARRADLHVHQQDGP